MNNSFVIEIHFGFFVKLCGEQLIDSFLNCGFKQVEISWKCVVNWFIGSFLWNKARFWKFRETIVVNNSLIHSCRSKYKHVALHSEIFWLLLWFFRENLWWIARLFRIFLIDSFGVFVKICGEHIDCRIKEAKLVLPAWFRNFSDCFLPIWRAFVVVYVLLLHQAIHSGPSGQ